MSMKRIALPTPGLPAAAIALALAAAPPLARADSGIPGVLILAAGSQTQSMLQWLAATMAMCIGVEWAVYRHSRQYRRPFVASAFSNVVSLVAGIPLTFIGMIDPTWFVIPTVVSILVEYRAITWIRRLVLAEGQARTPRGPVVWGNVVSNLMLMALLYVSILKSQGRFPLDIGTLLGY